jgi:hypothetical protein
MMVLSFPLPSSKCISLERIEYDVIMVIKLWDLEQESAYLI